MIHYHGIAGASHKFLATVMSGRHAFVSFADPGNLVNIAGICSTFALDNGAYSAWRKQKPYDFAGYQDWVKQWFRHPAYDWHVIPDEIDGDENTNRKLVETWPISGGIPVWHMHESLGFLKDLCSGFDTVALGSSGQYAVIGTQRWWGRMDEAMRHVCIDGQPPCRFHGLRMLRIDVCSKLPLHSGDSTTAVRDSKYDASWRGYNAPTSPHMRGLVIADRLESQHPPAQWKCISVQQKLFGSL
jgi:hypothetical protein